MFYNLDSKLEAPETIGAEMALKQFLVEQVGCKEKELLLVVTQVVAQTGVWICEQDVGEQHTTVVNGAVCANELPAATNQNDSTNIHRYIDSGSHDTTESSHLGETTK